MSTGSDSSRNDCRTPPWPELTYLVGTRRKRTFCALRLVQRTPTALRSAESEQAEAGGLRNNRELTDFGAGHNRPSRVGYAVDTPGADIRQIARVVGTEETGSITRDHPVVIN